jgi:hypothetical protein
VRTILVRSANEAISLMVEGRVVFMEASNGNFYYSGSKELPSVEWAVVYYNDLIMESLVDYGFRVLMQE